MGRRPELHSLHWTKQTACQSEAIAPPRRPGAVEISDMDKLIARIQERTGIYKLGFDFASMAGIALPIGFVIVVGGILSWLVLR